MVLVTGADTAGGLVEEQKLRPERIGDRNIEEFALALGETARDYVALPGKTELAEHRIRFRGNCVIEVSERCEIPRLALAGENRERDVLEGGKIIETGSRAGSCGRIPILTRSVTEAWSRPRP